MKIFSPASLRTAALGLTVAVSLSAHGAFEANAVKTEPAKAKTPATNEKKGVEKEGKKKERGVALGAGVVAAGENELGLLDHAYGILSHADHDYDGHRRRAMNNIEDAARALGAKLRGDGHGDEKQGTSDTQLRQAQSLLESAVGGLAGKPHHHVAAAINQLSIALRIK